MKFFGQFRIFKLSMKLPPFSSQKLRLRKNVLWNLTKRENSFMDFEMPKEAKHEILSTLYLSFRSNFSTPVKSSFCVPLVVPKHVFDGFAFGYLYYSYYFVVVFSFIGNWTPLLLLYVQNRPSYSLYLQRSDLICSCQYTKQQQNKKMMVSNIETTLL